MQYPAGGETGEERFVTFTPTFLSPIGSLNQREGGETLEGERESRGNLNLYKGGREREYRETDIKFSLLPSPSTLHACMRA